MSLQVGHLDADCFYVSAERVRYPHLRGLPVGVLGNHGACIIAKSYEMKASGVSTGMPIWDALPICPEGVYVKRDFQWYEILSRKMLSVVQEASPRVEFYSIDEFFFSTDRATGDDAAQLQRGVLDRVGVPVSIGIAPTKTLAKLISDSAKPAGWGVLLDDSDRVRLLRNKPVTEITGIAARSAKKLAEHGITTCEQYATADRALIRWLLTKRGEDLWWELNGTPVHPILPTRPEHKFISRGGSIGAASADPARIEAFVVRNAERLVEALNFYRIACRQLILTLLFSDRPEKSRRVSLLDSAGESIIRAALWLLPRVWQPRSSKVHYMHVVAGGLTRERQLTLFDDATPRAAEVAEVKRRINHEIGRFAIRSGYTLPLKDVHRDQANDYDICDIYGKTCF